jgi:hypothetical protein
MKKSRSCGCRREDLKGETGRAAAATAAAAQDQALQTKHAAAKI